MSTTNKPFLEIISSTSPGEAIKKINKEVREILTRHDLDSLTRNLVYMGELGSPWGYIEVRGKSGYIICQFFLDDTFSVAIYNAAGRLILHHDEDITEHVFVICCRIIDKVCEGENKNEIDLTEQRYREQLQSKINFANLVVEGKTYTPDQLSNLVNLDELDD